MPHLCAWLFQVYFHPLDAGKFFSGSEDGLVQLSSVAGVLDEEEGFLVSCATPCAVCMRPDTRTSREAAPQRFACISETTGDCKPRP